MNNISHIDAAGKMVDDDVSKKRTANKKACRSRCRRRLSSVQPDLRSEAIEGDQLLISTDDTSN